MNNWSMPLVGFLFLCSLAQAQFADHSVLSQGEWYQVCVSEEGVYRIDAPLLAEMGIDPSSVSPNAIHVFGQRGGMLPEPNAEARVDDLQALSVWVDGDEVYFWAEAPHQEYYHAATGRLVHQINHYSDVSCYFIKIDPALSQNTLTSQAPVSSASQVISTFHDLVWREDEEINILKSGRDWFGKRYTTSSEDQITFDLANVVANSPVSIRVGVMAVAYDAMSTFDFTLNGAAVGSVSVSPVSTFTYAEKGRKKEATFDINGITTDDNGSLTLGLAYQRPSNNAVGYLDFVEIQAERQLKYTTGQFKFQSLNSTSTPTAQYNISTTASGMRVWDVTSPFAANSMTLTSTSGIRSFKANSATLRTYVAFDPASVPAPTYHSAIANQDLHGLVSPDLLIITHVQFKAQAERLATFRRDFDGLSVAVVDIEEIYREFSSGTQDLVAMRDFIRMLYLRSDDDHQLKYVLLFGDASFDYMGRENTNTNFIPVYESKESLHPINSYSSDDYIALLDEDEGRWRIFDEDDMEVGVGRLPVQTTDQARAVVDKLIHYTQSPDCLGEWRNQLVFVADDGDGNLHQGQADRLGELVDSTYKDYGIAKLYVDAFPQVSQDANTKKSPQLRQKLNDYVQNGALTVNFTGHGSESGWTSEGILDVGMIEGWDNLDNMPLMMTATCEFGRYDDPGRASAGERSILHEKGGAIGLLTTTRPVYASNNYKVNLAFYQSLFEPLPNGEMPRLGDIIRKTKNASVLADGNRNFTLLGDPSLRMAYPVAEVVVTSLSTDESGETDTLKALNHVTIQGNIQQDGSVIESFEGEMKVTVFDKRVVTSTLSDEDPVMDFYERKKILFSGIVSVTRGTFTAQFVMPKDIDYAFGDGRMSFYAQPDQGLIDAAGHYDNLTIGGSARAFAPDDTPPVIQLYMEDFTFEENDVVRSAPRLIIRLQDESGINVTGTGVGHELKAEFLTDPREELILNGFYRSDRDDFTRGTAQYQFATENAFAPGRHTIRVTAWDIHNNPARQEITFTVLANGKIQIDDLQFYPNPTRGNATIRFCHNLASEDLQVAVEVYATDGKRVKHYDYQVPNASQCAELSLALGNDLLPGMYLYRLVIESHSVNTASVGRFILE